MYISLDAFFLNTALFFLTLTLYFKVLFVLNRALLFLRLVVINLELDTNYKNERYFSNPEKSLPSSIAPYVLNSADILFGDFTYTLMVMAFRIG